MLKNIFKVISFFIIGMVGGIFSTQILWPYFVERPLFLKYNLKGNPIYITERKEVHIQENKALQEAIEKVKEAVVEVRSIKLKGNKIVSESKGGGFIITADGLILTFSEIILPDFSKNLILTDEGLFEGELLKKDKNFSLLKIKKENLKTIPFSSFQELKLGERVFYFGRIKKENKILNLANEGIIRYFDKEKILTNMIESEALEGLPLFDIEGKLIGQIKIDKKNNEVSAFPVNKIKEFLGF